MGTGVNRVLHEGSLNAWVFKQSGFLDFKEIIQESETFVKTVF